jgi:hypothetical protein
MTLASDPTGDTGAVIEDGRIVYRDAVWPDALRFCHACEAATTSRCCWLCGGPTTFMPLRCVTANA